MMRDHVVGRTFTCDRAAHGNAQQAGKPSSKSANASADACARISNISDVPTSRFTLGKAYRSAKKTLRNTGGKLATAALSLALALTCVPAAGVAYATEADDVEADEVAEVAEAANSVEANGEAAGDSAAGTGAVDSASGMSVDASDGTSDASDTATAPIIANEETHRAYFLASTLQNTTVPIVQATVTLTPKEDAVQGDATEPTGDESALVISLVTGSFVYDGMTFAVTGQNEVTLAAIETTHLAQDVAESHTLVLPSKLSPNKNELYTLTSVSSQVFGEKRVVRPQAVASNSGAVDAASTADVADAGAGTEGAPGDSSEEGAEDSDDPDPDSDADGNASGAGNAVTARAEAVTASGNGAFIAEDVVLSERTVGDTSADDVPAITTIAVDAQLMTEAELTASTSSQYITALGIPATVTDVAADAFKNYEPLEYLVAAEGNTAYSTYDGALYNADQTSLLLIPEGRQGAVRVAVTATSVPAEMFSHHSGMALIVDAGSAAITSENGFLYNVDLATFDFPVPIAVVDDGEVVACTASFTAAVEQAAFDASVYDETPILEALTAAPAVVILWDGEYAENIEDMPGEPTEEEFIVPVESDAAVDAVEDSYDDSDFAEELAQLEEMDAMADIAPETLEEIKPFSPSSVISYTFDLRASAAAQSAGPVTVEEDVIIGEGENAINYSEHQMLDTVGGIGEAYWYVKRAITTTPSTVEGEPDTVENVVTLYIDCTEGSEIALTSFQTVNPSTGEFIQYGWRYQDGFLTTTQCWKGAWAPVRDYVNRIVMASTVRPEGTSHGEGSMNLWFAHMDGLKDISNVFVPDGVYNVNMLFYHSSTLKVIPASFTIGEGVEQASNLFQQTAIETLEAGFKLPSTLKNAHCMFHGLKTLKYIQPGFTLPDGIVFCSRMFQDCSNLQTLPAGFTIPASAVRTDQMFRNCSNLQTLPVGFTVPEGVQYVQSMFRNCTSLKRLPEGFSLPKNSAKSTLEDSAIQIYLGDIAGTMPYDYTFENCNSLNRLPDSFDFDLEKANTSTNFFKYTGPKSDLTDANGNLITYYSGSNSLVKSYSGWVGASPSQKRILQGTPSGALKVMFMTPTGNSIEGFGWEPWAVVYTDSAKKIPEANDPGTPSMKRFEFSGSWYTSPSLTSTSKLQYGTTVLAAESSGITYVYAGYSVIGDALATVTNGVPDVHPRASWQLEFADKYSADDEGNLVISRTTTLHLSCEQSAEIADSNFTSTRTVNGTTETVAGSWVYQYTHSGAWAAVRGKVQRVVMDPEVKPEGTTHGVGSMKLWFGYMPSLTDISNVFVPDGVAYINMMFFADSQLSNVPSTFKIGEGVIHAGNLFQSTSVTEIEEGFTLPSTVKSIGCMFYRTELKSIPAGFTLPEGLEASLRAFSRGTFSSLPAGFKLPSTLKVAYGMFSECANLETLPAGFTIPEGVQYIQQMFQGCSSLKTLPEGFSLPVSSLKASRGDDDVNDTNDMRGVGALDRVFNGCNALRVLPDSFDFNLDQANDSDYFFLYSGGKKEDDSTDAGGNLITTYAGKSAAVKAYAGWTGASPSQKRILQGVPANCLKVQFMVPDDSAAEGWSVWTTRITDTAKKVPEVSDPGKPTLGFFDFEGWYTNSDLAATSAFTFGSTQLSAVAGVPNTARLYAKCDRIGGNLATVTNGKPDVTPRASWRIATDTQTGFDGTETKVTTLFIDSEPGAEIARSNFVSTWTEDGEVKTENLWSWHKTRSGAWESVRGQVNRIVMSKSVRPEGSSEGTGEMNCWFYSMKQLTDITDVFVPAGVRDITTLFFGCSNLSRIPASFTLGEGVEKVGNLFQSTAVNAVDEGFLLPSTVVDAHCLFYGTQIKALPAGFMLPEGMENVMRMFANCRSLKSLPSGFLLPDSTKVAYGMFDNCSALEALPAGFTIPEGVQYIQQMFKGCSSLQALPEGFSLPQTSLKASRGEDKITDISKDDLGALDTVFSGCNSLKDLPDSFDFNVSQAYDSANFFAYTGGAQENGITDANGNLVTLYLGTNESVLNYTGWLGANPSQKRILRSKADLAKEGLAVVRFALPNAGHGMYSSSITPDYFVTASSVAGDTVAYPGSPKPFGYAFDELHGWRAGLDENRTYPSVTEYNFSRTLASQLTADTTEQVDVGGGVKKPLKYYTIYAHLTGPIYNVSVPVTATARLDMVENTTLEPAVLTFTSLTPEPLTVTRVQGGLGWTAARLFASDEDFAKAGMQAEITLGDKTVSFDLPKEASDGTLVGSGWNAFDGTAVIPKSSGFRTYLNGTLGLTVTGGVHPITQASADGAAWLMWQVEDPAIGELIVD